MSIVRLSSVVASALTLCALVACTGGSSGESTSSGGSSGSSGSTSSSSSSSSSSSGSGDPSNAECALAPGTYTAKYTTKPGGTGPAGMDCQDIPGSEFEIKPSSGDGGTAEPAEGCTVDVDEASCTVSSTCVTTANGQTTTTRFTVTNSGEKANGSQSTKVVKDDDSVVMDCSWDFEWTKK